MKPRNLRKPRILAAQVAVAEEVVKTTRDARELRQAQAVLLPVRHGLSLEETGGVIGRSKATVARMLVESRRQVEEADRPRPQWGGRRRQNMSPEEEKAFLAPFFSQAERGGMLVVAPIKAAYEKALGRSVPESTVYRFLARHDWRKLAPRPRHPKGSPERREAWKKNSPKR
jgi:transposase